MIMARIATDRTTIAYVAWSLFVVMALIGISLIRSVRRMEDEEVLRQREVALLRKQNNEIVRKVEAQKSLIDWYVDQAREGGYNVDR